MMRRVVSAILPLAVLIVTITGCNTSGCLENASSIPLAGFYSSQEKASISLNFISVGGVGAPNDSLLVYPGTDVSACYLPLRSQYTTTQYCLGFDYPAVGLTIPSDNDTLTIVYNSIPYFQSEECGAMYRYEIKELRYTTNVVDSVIVLDSLITNVDIERLKIYLDTDRFSNPEGGAPEEL